jgi:hypothetical protein
MSAVKSSTEVQQIYADLAPKMDRMAWLNRLVTGRHRRRLFGRVRGRTLDVASGLGLNLSYLPDGVEYVGVDLSPEMVARARERFADHDGWVDNFDAVVRQVQAATAGWTPRGASREHPPLVIRSGREERVASNIVRTHVALFAPGYSAQDERRYAAAMIASCLGDTSSGRLYWELVDEGVADSASLSHDSGDGVGSFVGYLSTAPDRLEEVMERARGVLEAAQDEGLEPEEWRRTQRRIATSLTLGAETPFGRLMPLGRDILYRDETRSLQELVDEVMAASVDDANELLAERPFDRSFSYVLVPDPSDGPTHPQPGFGS